MCQPTKPSQHLPCPGKVLPVRLVPANAHPAVRDGVPAPPVADLEAEAGARTGHVDRRRVEKVVAVLRDVEAALAGAILGHPWCGDV